MNEPCRRYLEDPEANAAHLQQCASCRALFEDLNTSISDPRVQVRDLPLAPWEGATYRSWPLVMAGAAMVLIAALALCAAVGLSPLHAISMGIGSTAMARSTLLTAADAVRNASMIWQIAFGALFLLVNTALVLLLRRAPRGIDA
jgi:predicted anti-sigma-YlaC factor YlaD